MRIEYKAIKDIFMPVQYYATLAKNNCLLKEF